MFSRSVVSNSLPSHGIFLARLRKWAAISSSNRSSWHRDRTDVSCIGRWILYHQATGEAHICQCYSFNSSCPPLQAYLHLILANLREERQLRKHTQWDFGAFPRSHCKSTWGLSGDLRTSDSTPTVGSAKRGESRKRESRGRRGVQGHVQRYLKVPSKLIELKLANESEITLNLKNTNKKAIPKLGEGCISTQS